MKISLDQIQHAAKEHSKPVNPSCSPTWICKRGEKGNTDHNISDKGEKRFCHFGTNTANITSIAEYHLCFQLNSLRITPPIWYYCGPSCWQSCQTACLEEWSLCFFLPSTHKHKAAFFFFLADISVFFGESIIKASFFPPFPLCIAVSPWNFAVQAELMNINGWLAILFVQQHIQCYAG